MFRLTTACLALALIALPACGGDKEEQPPAQPSAKAAPEQAEPHAHGKEAPNTEAHAHAKEERKGEAHAHAKDEPEAEAKPPRNDTPETLGEPPRTEGHPKAELADELITKSRLALREVCACKDQRCAKRAFDAFAKSGEAIMGGVKLAELPEGERDYMARLGRALARCAANAGRDNTDIFGHDHGHGGDKGHGAHGDAHGKKAELPRRGELVNPLVRLSDEICKCEDRACAGAKMGELSRAMQALADSGQIRQLSTTEVKALSRAQNRARLCLDAKQGGAGKGGEDAKQAEPDAGH